MQAGIHQSGKIPSLKHVCGYNHIILKIRCDNIKSWGIKGRETIKRNKLHFDFSHSPSEVGILRGVLLSRLTSNFNI